MALTVEELKSLLKLRPLPVEGGYFCETYRSPETIPSTILPSRYSSPKAFGTAIYFLLTSDTFSALHRLPTDEIYHFYIGDPVELLQLHPDGSGTTTILGHDLENGMLPQIAVPRGTWQGSRLRQSGVFALMGTTMAPGFDPSDLQTGDTPTLLKTYPAFHDLIIALTRHFG